MFARYTFGHPERAAAELRAVLPPELVAQVDWSSLHREPGSVVDLELRERQSDLLFSARLHGGRPVLFYFLLEHQSSVDRWMALRMLRYVVRQLDHWRHLHPDNEWLPTIIPMVLYHGQEGRWTAARRLEELFFLPDEHRERWRKVVPRFEYLVDDLTAEREEALRARPGPPLVRMTWLLLRSSRSRELAVLLEGWKPLLEEVLASPEGLEQLRSIVHYLLRVGPKDARPALRRVLDSMTGEQQAEELMKTMAEDLIEQGERKGRRKGRAEGIAEGRAQSVLQILSARHITVDEQTRERILSCKDLKTLDRWLHQALDAKSLADLTLGG